MREKLFLDDCEHELAESLVLVSDKPYSEKTQMVLPWYAYLFKREQQEVDPDSVFDELLSFYNDQVANESDE